MKQIPIENFLKMTPEAPQYSLKNPNYLIVSNPNYYLESNAPQEEQIAPLIANQNFNKLDVSNLPGGVIDGNIVHIVASTQGNGVNDSEIFFITNSSHVYSVAVNTLLVTDLGYPSGAPVPSNTGRLAIAAGFVFAIFSTQVYKHPILPGAWTPVGAAVTTSVQPHFMEPFTQFIPIATGAGANTPNSQISYIDLDSFIVVNYPSPNTINLGTGFGIMGLSNYNNKYIAIAYGNVGGNVPTFGHPQNYIGLWDGKSIGVNYNVKIPGQFLGMQVINSTLYVAVQVSIYKTVLYYLAGTTLKEVFNPAYSLISNGDSAAGTMGSDCLFNYNNLVGLRLANNDDLSEIETDKVLMVHGEQEAGMSEFILASGLNFDQFCVGFSGILFASVNKFATPSDLYVYDPLSIDKTYSSILYRSQWIPVKNLKAIDIYYDTPPQTVSDKISVTIFGKGEDIIAGLQTIVLQDITSTNILTKSRTRLMTSSASDTFVGDKLKIQLTTTNSGEWRPIIRAIVPIVE